MRLISPQYVSPFVKTNNNDRNDAQAIVEAASRPTMNFVTLKSVKQQDMQAVHRVRELLVHQRTALINQARGILGERGVTMAQSPATAVVAAVGDAKEFRNGRHLSAWLGLVPRQYSSAASRSSRASASGVTLIFVPR